MDIDDLNNKLANTLVALKRKYEQTTNENEKEVAIRFLNSQLKKHGLDMSIFDDMLLEKKQRYELKHHGMFGKALKVQILWFLGYETVYKVLNSRTIHAVKMTKSDYVTYQIMFDKYREVLDKEIKATYLALLQKNQLFGVSSDDEDYAKNSEDVLEMMRKKIDGMSDININKSLEHRQGE